METKVVSANNEAAIVDAYPDFWLVIERVVKRMALMR